MISYCLVPDQVIVSPARRTQETWAVLTKAFSEGPNVVTDEHVYEASAETLIHVGPLVLGAIVWGIGWLARKILVD